MGPRSVDGCKLEKYSFCRFHLLRRLHCCNVDKVSKCCSWYLCTQFSNDGIFDQQCLFRCGVLPALIAITHRRTIIYPIKITVRRRRQQACILYGVVSNDVESLCSVCTTVVVIHTHTLLVHAEQQRIF